MFKKIVDKIKDSIFFVAGKKWSLTYYKDVRGDVHRYYLDSSNDEQFDEIKIDDWLHLEMMNERLYWIRLGERSFDLKFDKSGKMTMEEQR